MTMTDTPERARRVADLWTRHPNMSRADAFAAVDAELEAEAEARAEQEARTDASVASFDRLTRCGCCRAASALGARDGLCDACRPVVAVVRAEGRAAEMIGDRSRRELANAYMEERKG